MAYFGSPSLIQKLIDPESLVQIRPQLYELFFITDKGMVTKGCSHPLLRKITLSRVF